MTMLMHVPRVLGESQLGAILNKLAADGAPWVDGRVTAGHQNVAVKSNQQLDESSALARELGGVVLAALERSPLFVGAVLPYRVYPPMFNRFAEGMQFGTHVDGAIRMLRASGQKLRTDLSATLFLTQPASYDGGELVIDSDFGSQSVKLAAGDLAVYPSTMLHRVNPVTRGQRLASVFWVQSLVRDDLRRSQLFELDRTIQQLTRTGADAESLVRLAAHYHALLRAWAET
jgi:PKHD-type hydroxylase